MAKKILITGASGLVGSRLTEMLVAKNYSVVHLGRTTKDGPVKSFVWDVNKFVMDAAALDGVDTIIHLAGAGVVDKRWSNERKKELLDSRVKSIDLIHAHLLKGNHQVHSFIGASAIGYYGAGYENVFQESSPPGADFLSQLVVAWEASSEKLKKLNIRVAKIRIGIALSAQGGALKSMAQPVRLGVGAALGSGNQYISWVHLDDLCRAFLFAVENTSMEGPYNVAGVNPATNREMTKAIATILKKPLWLPAVPAFVLNALMGEMAFVILTGSKVSSNKIIEQGFTFQFTDLDAALTDLYKH